MRWSLLNPSSVRSGQRALLRGDDASPLRHQVIERPPIKEAALRGRKRPLVSPSCPSDWNLKRRHDSDFH